MFWPKELVRGILKMWLGVIILGISLWVMYAAETGDFLLSALPDSTDVSTDIIKTIIGKLPFLGYVADVFDVKVNIFVTGGYGVLHDFSKAVLLFLVTHFSFGIIKSACGLLGRGVSPRTPYALIYRGISNLGVGVCICVSSMVMMCVLHELTLAWWLGTFGNSSVSNWCYLGALAALVACIFVVLPITGRKPLLDSLGEMLTDFGLSLCAVTLGFSLLTVAQGGLGSKAETVRAVILPYIASGAGLVILLRIRLRNT